MPHTERALGIVALLAFVYSIAVVWGGAWLVVAARSRPFPTDELMPLIMQTGLAFLPFLILLLVARYQYGRRRLSVLKPVLTGFTFSILLWGYYYYYSITYDGRTGVPYGLLMAMLFSPLIVYVPMHFILSRARR